MNLTITDGVICMNPIIYIKFMISTKERYMDSSVGAIRHFIKKAISTRRRDVV